MRHLGLSSLLAMATAGVAAAQALTVPAAVAADAPGLLWIAGATAKLRQQVLIDASHLTALVGREITAISFRRDTGAAHRALNGARPTWAVVLSSSPRSARSPSSIPAENVGADAVTVFAGTVTVPAAPAVAPRAAVGWTTEHTVRVAFTTPYRYSGGTLCIDVDGDPAGTASDFWPADAVRGPVTGTTAVVGTGCGARGGGPTLTVDRASLVPGGAAVVVARGEPAAAAVLAIGLGAAPDWLPLQPFGWAPGCALHVTAIVGSLGAVFGPAVGTGFHGGLAIASLPLPADPALANARFAVQALELGSQWCASNAVDCTLAAGASALGMATVTRIDGAPGGLGRVLPQVAPVLRFESR